MSNSSYRSVREHDNDAMILRVNDISDLERNLRFDRVAMGDADKGYLCVCVCV